MDGARSLFTRLFLSVAIPAAIIVGSVYIFNSLGNIVFLGATILAFAVGFFAIYLVFKYWISPDEEHGSSHQQLVRFMIVFIVTLGINTEIVYILTYFEVDLLVAQTVSAVILAYVSFYAYRSLVFYGGKKTTVVDEISPSTAAGVNP